MKKILPSSILAFIIVINTGGPKPCIESVYSFAIQSQLIPDKDSANIGDTIYLISSTATAMKDLVTGAQVDYSGATIGNTLSIGELIPGTTFPKDAVFDLIM